LCTGTTDGRSSVFSHAKVPFFFNFHAHSFPASYFLTHATHRRMYCDHEKQLSRFWWIHTGFLGLGLPTRFVPQNFHLPLYYLSFRSVLALLQFYCIFSCLTLPGLRYFYSYSYTDMDSPSDQG
jgi:hypothetical protein